MTIRMIIILCSFLHSIVSYSTWRNLYQVKKNDPLFQNLVEKSSIVNFFFNQILSKNYVNIEFCYLLRTKGESGLDGMSNKITTTTTTTIHYLFIFHSFWHFIIFLVILESFHSFLLLNLDRLENVERRKYIIYLNSERN